MNSFENDIYANTPNQSLMFTMYSTTFGNMNFNLMPASKGEVQRGFPSVPYLSLEALLYQQQASNPIVQPMNVQSGATAGTQNISGNLTSTDNTGNIRVAIGNGSY